MSDEEQQPKTDVVPQRFEEDELRKLLHDLVKRKGLVGAAKALGVNFRTLTGSIDSGKLSRRMREALVKEIQAEGGDEEQKEREEECRIEQVMQQVESMAEELIGIRGGVERPGGAHWRTRESTVGASGFPNPWNQG